MGMLNPVNNGNIVVQSQSDVNQLQVFCMSTGRKVKVIQSKLRLATSSREDGILLVLFFFNTSLLCFTEAEGRVNLSCTSNLFIS